MPSYSLNSDHNMDNARILNMLGIACKANAIISGEESVVCGLQNKKVKLVFVANDASSTTITKFSKKCFYYNVTVDNTFSSDELSKAIGKERKIVGVTDNGFCNAIKKIMEESK